MATQIHNTAAELRRRILTGHYRPGERLVELAVSAELGASRTPIRLAFEELEREGLLERLPTRGFRIKAFTADDIADAVDVRGVLEGMAARRLAERRPDTATVQTLQACISLGRLLLDEASNQDWRIDASRWIPMNARFHAALVGAAGNRTLVSALEHVSKTPLAGAAALSLHGTAPLLEHRFIQRAQQDHEDILAALVAGESARAEALMREHAHRSRDNKRELLTGQRFQNPPAPT